MANISSIERRKLERLFRMGSGYVLDFSDRTFSECWRRSKSDPPCRLNFDPGLGAGIS